MKKLLLLFTMMLLVVGNAFAAFPDPTDTDTKAVFDSIQNIRYTVEAKGNYNDYSEVVKTATISFAKYKDKHPEPDADKNKEILQSLIEPYQDAKTAWSQMIANGVPVYADDYGFVEKYGLQGEHFAGSNMVQGRYALDVMWDVASSREKYYAT